MAYSLTYIYILVTLFFLEIIYFRFAEKFNIIDNPNDRSSHTSVTLRGGGIIFPFAAVLYCICFKFQFPFFIIGLLAISFISFLDDLYTLSNKIRIAVHLVAVGLILYEWNTDIYPWFYLVLIAIVVIGTINAYNFMDGINGITGAYSMVVVASLCFINENIIGFTSTELLVVMAMALIVFNYFNFRKKAKCFAGDVGSVSIAFIIIFLIGQLILETNNMLYLMLLLVYGLDALTTIIFRLIRKENIFKAHRSHFYQYLANEKKWSHLWVSVLYASCQIAINGLLISLYSGLSEFGVSFYYLLAAGTVSGLFFILMRITIEGKQRLFATGAAS